MSNTIINIKNSGGVILDTYHKYCDNDIQINPVLQSKNTTTNGTIVPDDGYCGLSSVEVNVTQIPAQTKTVDLAMADGDQTIPPDSGKTLSSVTVIKPSTMLPANIKKGVNIGGVVGTLEGGIDISDTTATAADVRVGKDFYAADGTKTQGTIADYDGSFTGAGSRSNLNVHYGDTAPEDTSKLWIKSTEPESIEFIQNPEQQVQGLTTLSATLPTGTSGIGTAAVGTKIYLFGGGGIAYGSSRLNTIQEFDTETKTRTKLSVTLPTAMGEIAAAAVGTKIYLFGGRSDSSRLNTIQEFDTETKTIQTLSVTLPTAASGIAAAAVGTKIYLFGGSGSSSSYLNTIQEFDTETKTRTTLSVTLSRTAYGIGAAAVGTKIYLFGGVNDYRSNTIQEFDTETKTLTTLSATLPTAAGDIGTAAVGTKIYLFGGGSLNTIQEFIVTFVLTMDNILGQQDYDKNIFVLVQSPTKVTIGLKNVYKGNSSNVAEFVDAYLYNGTNWANVNTGETA